jgi:two-component system, OmpR family, response regulator
MRAGHRHILVVEDDQETAGQLVESFTAHGHRVNLAANGNDALSLGVSGDSSACVGFAPAAMIT